MIRNSNFIGFSAGVGPAGNGLEGIKLVNSRNSTLTPYSVRSNGAAGIAITGATATSNFILASEIYGNGGLGIDLGADGPTPNDVGDSDTGPNQLLNYPTITGAAGSGLAGQACANCQVFIYKAFGTTTAPGGGGGLLQAATANSAGAWSTTLPSGTGRGDVTLVAYDPLGNVSEFSPRTATFIPLVLR